MSFWFIFGITSGGLFDEQTTDAEWAFQYAVEAINNQRYNMTDGTLETTTVRVNYGDQFDASKKLCRLLKVKRFFCRFESRLRVFLYN